MGQHQCFPPVGYLPTTCILNQSQSEMRRWWRASGPAGSFSKCGLDGFTGRTKPIFSPRECTSHLGFSLVNWSHRGWSFLGELGWPNSLVRTMWLPTSSAVSRCPSITTTISEKQLSSSALQHQSRFAAMSFANGDSAPWLPLLRRWSSEATSATSRQHWTKSSLTSWAYW